MRLENLRDTKQCQDDWFAKRRWKVTASAAAAVLGLHENLSHAALARRYAEEWGVDYPGKKPIPPPSDFAQSLMDFGVANEPYVRNTIEQRLPDRGVLLEGGYWEHPSGFFGASPDGLICVPGRETIYLEIKSTQALLPQMPHYKTLVQVIMGMDITGCREGLIAYDSVHQGEHEFRFWVVKWGEDLDAFVQFLYAEGRKFITRVARGDIPKRIDSVVKAKAEAILAPYRGLAAEAVHADTCTINE